MQERKSVKAQKQKKTRLLIKFCCFAVALLLCCSAVPAYGAGGDILWQYGVAKTGKQEAKAMIVDTSGNVIITGYQNISEGADNDYYTVKIKSDGSGIAWEKTFDKAGGDDQATAVAVDSNNDVIVTGYSLNGTNYDIHTIKYSGATGNLLWQHSYNGSANGNDYATSVAIDGSNNIYVGGYLQNASGNDDYLVLKYGTGGTTPLWQAMLNGTGSGNDRIMSIAAGADKIAVTGYSWNGSNFDFLTAAYNLSGSKLWEKRYPSSGSDDDLGEYVKIDSLGNVVVTGYARDGANKDIYTAKYNGSTGVLIWGKTYAANYDDEPKALSIGTNNNVYVTGYTWTLTGHNDFYTVKYDKDTGEIIWEQVFNAGVDTDDIPAGMVINSSEEVFVTGYTITDGNSDFITLKYKKDNGDLLWQSSFNGAANKSEKPVGIGIASSGDIFVAGWSDMWTSGSPDYDYYAIKYDHGLLNRPTHLTAEAASNTMINITWADNSDSEDGFKVERTICGGTYAQIATVSANTITYNDNNSGAGLTPDTRYCYRVRAYNSAQGNTNFSNEAAATTTIVPFSAPPWVYTFNGSDSMDDFASAIAVGPDNNPVVTGYSNSLDTGFDYLTVKMNRTNGNQIWSAGYALPLSETADEAQCVSVDNNNAVIVSGYSNLYNGVSSTNDIYTIKYPSTGTPESWNAKYDGPGGDDDRSVSVATSTDGSNNIVVVGYGRNASFNDDMYVIKYLSGGTRSWASVYDNGGNDYPSAVVFDASGNIFIAGYTHNGSNYDMLTAKYNGSTGALIWSDIYNGTGNGNDEANALAVDSSGNVFVAGHITNASGNEDFYTIKYNGTTGGKIWTHSYNGTANGNDAAEAVKVDPVDGNVVVSGTTFTGGGNNDFHIIRYDTNGSVVWEKTLARPSNDDYVFDMGMDKSGNVCIAGNTSNGGPSDIMSIKYSWSGEVIGATIYNGAADSYDIASAVAVNTLGEAFIAGSSMNASGDYDYVVYKCAFDPLQAPYPLSTTPGYTSVALAWADNTSEEDGYRIQRKTGGCLDSDINNFCNPGDAGCIWTWSYDVSASTTSYNNTGLSYGTNYCYRVKAFKNTGEYSRWVGRSALTKPAAPTLNSLSVVSQTQIDLSWNNVSGNSGYKVERSLNGTSWSQVGSDLAADTTSYSNSGLTAGILYYYRVLAFNTTGNSSYSNVQSATTIPPVPVLNTPVAASTTQINLAWADVSGETGYDIQYKLQTGGDCTAGAWTLIAPSKAANSTSHSVTGLTEGTVYCFQISAFNDAGESSFSASVSQMTLIAAPTLNILTGITASKIDLSWNNVTGNTGYKVERSLNGSTWSQVSTDLAADTTNFSNTGLTAGTLYYYRVSTKNAGGYSVPSNVQSATTIPPTPTGLTATAASTSQINLLWTAASGATGYNILYKQGTDCTGGTTLTVGATISQPFTGLTPGTTYCYQINASNNAGTSSYSSPITRATITDAPALNALSGITASSITLTWNNVTGNTGYRVERSPNGTSSWVQVGTDLAADTITYPNTGLSAGTLYYYRVYAKNANGILSAASNTQSATTIPPTPTGLTATADSSSQITFGWADVLGETGYDIQYKLQTGGDCTAGSWSLISKSAGSTSHSFTGLTSGTTYCYQIRASNSSGSSAYSTAISKTTLLGPPTLNALTVVSSSRIDLGWNNVTGNTGYKVERSLNGTSWVQVGSDLAANTTTYSNTGLTAGTLYYYRVSTKNSGGYTVPSNVQSAWTIPATPVLTATAASTTQINLAWADVLGETGYDIQYKLQTGGDCTAGSWSLISKSAGSTSHSFTGLTSGSTYCYQIRASNSSGSSPYSTAISQTTLLVAPALNALTVVSSSRIDLGWNNVTGNTGYKVERSLNGTSWSQVGSDLAANTTTYSNTGLSAGTLYYYRVSTKNSGGYSATSNVQSAWTIPATPVLTATAASTTQINLAWADVLGETGYDIQYKLQTGGDCTAGAWALLAKTAGSTSHSFTGLTSGSTYCYQIRASNSSGSSPYSTAISQTTLLVAPALNALTVVSSSRIDLGWNNVTGNTGYKVERSLNGTSWSQVGSDLAANTTTYSNTGLTAGTLYYYRVSTKNSGGYSATSNVQSAWTIPATPVLTATAASTTQINLAWADVLGETGYDIQYKLQTGGDCTAGSWSLISKSAGSTSHSFTGLTSGSTYCYQIRASNSSGSSSYSTAISKTTLLGPPALNALTVVSSSRIDLDWNNVTGNTGYKVERSLNGTSWVQVGSDLAANTTTYSNTGLSAGTLYYYRVSTKNSGGYSATSNVRNATTLLNPPALNALTVVSSSRIDLNWNNVTGNTGYRIERSYDNVTWIQVGSDLAANTTTYSNTGLSAGTVYYYRVFVGNVTGYSVPSNVQSATTLLGPPTLSNLTVISTAQINLVWSNVSENTGYRLERSLNNVTWSQVGSDLPANTTTYSNTGLSAGTLYYYRVKTKNAGGYTVPSNVLSGTTYPAAPILEPLILISSSQINLEWNNVTSNTGYKIERSLNGSSWAPLGSDLAANTNSYSNTGLFERRMYYYRVSTKNVTGYSVPSNVESAQTPLSSLAELTATAINSMIIQLAWTDLVADDGYEVEIEVKDGIWVLRATLSSNVRSFTDTIGIEANSQYHYRVRSFRGSDKSLYSEAWVTTPAYQSGDNTCPP